MRLPRLLMLSLAATLCMVCVAAIILPGETDTSSSSSSSPTAATPSTYSSVGSTLMQAPSPAPVQQVVSGSTRTSTATTVLIETDIAENIAELDVDVMDQGHSSKEVQDSDGGQRQNYASKDSGATVLDHAPGTKGSVNLLVPDKDRYMLIPCASEKKWVVISLSEDIHADAIAIANYEKFSSPTREFLVLGSINYPSDTWVVLGNFTAAHRNGEQLFDFHEKHHVRYIKLRMMSHYGSEYYCTMSQIRVFGRTFTQVISQLEKTIEAEALTPSPAAATPAPPRPAPPSASKCPAPAPDNALSLFLPSPTLNPAAASTNDTCLRPVEAPEASNGTAETTVVVSSSAGTATPGAHPSPSNSSNSGTATGPTAPPSSAGQGGGSATKPDAARAVESDHAKEGSDDAKATAPATAPASNNGLDNFYIRMSKKLQLLEMNVTQLEKALHDLQRSHAVAVQTRVSDAIAAAEALATLKAQCSHNVSVQANVSNDLAKQLLLLRHDHTALREQVEMVWDVIRTMKAGIMAALLLSAVLLSFSICRWVFRCLTACHRRAARREWFRRLDVADTTETHTSPTDLDGLDDEINPLTQTMHHRVDRNMRFGSSYDDGAIQRNTMYRRIVNGFRQHHVQTKRRYFHRGGGGRLPSMNASSNLATLASSSLGTRRRSIAAVAKSRDLLRDPSSDGDPVDLPPGDM